ncbi:uncharacterized protein LOC120677371 [Panicum virgatum]|uniref:uncharacterized protein LOC120677371 n=1 Tax=Panicum virgatum TaxID=38727 RepID=UPI0019D60DAA|nr:uncharacterized protein LOC120677371 [Panicum virgatum]
MVHVRIFCHADIQALQRSDQKLVYVDLVSLESLRIASDSCALLVNLIQRRDWQCTNLLDRRYWHCHQMDLLSLMAGVALELHKIKHDLYPLLVSQEAKLEGGFLKDLRLLKNSAVTLVRLAKEAKEIVEGCVDEEDVEDVHVFRLLGKVKEVGKAVEDTADLVLKGFNFGRNTCST